jgi:hypothetical protein
VATVLEAREDADPEALVEHWLGAGERGRAAAHAESAAERAAEALAFGRAAELYTLCAELQGDAAGWDLYERLGRALALDGRGAAAGRWYDRAAETRAAQEGDTPEVRLAVLDLQRQAAVHSLRAGALEDGLTRLRDVLRAFGVSPPSGGAAAMARAIFGRGMVIVRGLEFRERPAADVPAETLARLDALWGASTTLSMIHHAEADAYGVAHLREALEVGEPSRVVRALGYEAAFEATIGGPRLQRRALSLLDRMDRLVASTDAPYDRAWATATRGTVLWMQGDFAGSLAQVRPAQRAFLEECRGASWEAAVCTHYSLSALRYVGRIAELCRYVDEKLQDALERGDRFVEVGVRLRGSFATLLRRGPEAAEAEAEAAIASWAGEGFGTQRYYHLVAVVEARIAQGRGEAAWAAVDAVWGDVEKAQLLRIGVVGAELRGLRGRAALAAGRVGPARDEARRLLKSPVPFAPPMGRALLAGVAALGGDATGARAQLAEAVPGFAASGQAMHAAIAGQLCTAGEGGADPGAAWAEAEGISTAVHTLAGLLFPGLAPPPAG